MPDNDDEENEQPHIHGVMFGPSPKEIQAMQDQAQMAYVAVRHGIDSMVRGLSKDDLIALRWLLQQIGDHENFKLASFYEGKISGLLEFRHKICGACGVDHEEAMHNEMDREIQKQDLEVPKKTVHPDVLPNPDENEGAELITAILSNDKIDDELMQRISRYKSKPPTTQLEREMMSLYDLDDLWEGDTEQSAVFIGYVCKKCKMHYVSIQDRMVKPVDECQGCFHKSAHG